MLLLAFRDRERFTALMQEDRVVEWMSAALFAAAGAVRLPRAIRERRVFDLLVALFCLVVAGEEFSWGQRLLGFTPPAYFLERNVQQEFNLHNLHGTIGNPRRGLMLIMAGYSVLLPLAAMWRPTRRVLDTIGATAPSWQLAPWFLACIGILLWYPASFTGEWVEMLAGALFLYAAALPAAQFWVTVAAGLAVSAALTTISARSRGGDASRLVCARAEAAALVADLTRPGAPTARLRRRRGVVDRRVWAAWESGYIEIDSLRTFYRLACPGVAGKDPAERRRYVVDPWGTSYWLLVDRPVDSLRPLRVYSYGPNRRGDQTSPSGGDDVAATGMLPVRAPATPSDSVRADSTSVRP